MNSIECPPHESVKHGMQSNVHCVGPKMQKGQHSNLMSNQAYSDVIQHLDTVFEMGRRLSQSCMLQARSHKKEVILVHFRDREIGMALNMVLNLRKLTFEHFILLTLDEASCQHVLKAFPKAGDCSLSASCTCL